MRNQFANTALLLVALAVSTEGSSQPSKPTRSPSPEKTETKEQVEARFTVVAKDILQDSKTSLQWTVADNGKDIDWPGAHRRCADMGSNWRLPTRGELMDLLHPKLRSKCGSNMCFSTEKLRLTGSHVWSSETTGESPVPKGATIVLFELGNTFVAKATWGEGQRALCVRPA